MVFGVDKKRAVYLGVKISFGTLVILLLLLIGTQLINSALNRANQPIVFLLCFRHPYQNINGSAH